MKRIKMTCVLVLAIGLSACSDSNISQVKNGTLALDKSLTIGQAIDNYKYFSKTKWETLTTENKKKVVQVSGKIDLSKHPNINQKEMPVLKEVEMRFQFVINQDKTFELSWCGTWVEKNNGEKVEPPQQTYIEACINSLKAIYNNSPDI